MKTLTQPTQADEGLAAAFYSARGPVELAIAGSTAGLLLKLLGILNVAWWAALLTGPVLIAWCAVVVVASCVATHTSRTVASLLQLPGKVRRFLTLEWTTRD